MGEKDINWRGEREDNEKKDRVIFLVDDSKITREIMPKLMARYAKEININCQIETFASAEEVIEAIYAGKKAHLVVTDQNMEGMLGTDLIEFIHTSDTIPHKPNIVLISGDTTSKEICQLKKSRNQRVKAIITRSGGREDAQQFVDNSLLE